MKNSLAVFCGAVMFCALAVSHAQTPGRQMGDPGNKPQPGTMSAQQHTQQMMGSQMMNRDQLRQMSTMMEQMNRLMQDMNRVSQQQQTMDQTRQRLLQAGKRKKVAITACMRKLITILNAVPKYQQPWDYNPVCP